METETEVSADRALSKTQTKEQEVRKYDKEDAPSGSPVPDSLS